MREYEFGGLVLSMAGHDKGTLYVIIDVEEEYVILADGKLRTVEHPKRKKKKHVQYMSYRCSRLQEERERTGRLTNEMIKYELKEYQRKIQGGFYV